jgi:MGT family glycosyltransferase
MKTQPKKSLRFLITTWEGGGVIAPALTVARKLMERGHHVRVLSDHVNRLETEQIGAGFRPWHLAPSRRDRTRESCPLRDWEAATPEEGVGRLISGIMFGPALDYARDVIAELRREPADVVVTCEMLPGVMAACESLGQRMAAFAANLCFYPVAGMPPFGPGVPPPRTLEEVEQQKHFMAGSIAMFDAGLDSMNRTRLALGLKPLEHASDQIRAADVYMLGTSRAFDFPLKQMPEQICYIGPQLDEPAWAEPWKSPWPVDDRRPMIAVGFSTTFQNHASALQNVVDAAATFPVKTLVTLGQISKDEVRTAGNTVLVPSAPHNAFMKEASVVVTHGGHGTVLRALMHRRPMLIMPHGRDQQENAIRVTERGAGICLPSTASHGEIADALRQLLQDPSYATAAAKLGRAVAENRHHASVTDVLEQLAAAGKPRSLQMPSVLA